MRIAVTRVAGKGGADKETCASFGHECCTVSPLAAEVDLARIHEFSLAVNRGEFDAIFFTSALPARIIAPLLKRTPRIIAIGPQTAETLRKAGVDAEVLPTFYSRDFVPYLGDWIRGRRIGIPRADVPNQELIDGITAAGGIAREVRCYSLIPTGTELDLGAVDAVLFTSALSFKTTVWRRRESLLLMAIGERTAEAMREGNAEPAVVGDGSLRGTLQRLNEYMEEKR